MLEHEYRSFATNCMSLRHFFGSYIPCFSEYPHICIHFHKIWLVILRSDRHVQIRKVNRYMEKGGWKWMFVMNNVLHIRYMNRYSSGYPAHQKKNSLCNSKKYCLQGTRFRFSFKNDLETFVQVWFTRYKKPSYRWNCFKPACLAQ